MASPQLFRSPTITTAPVAGVSAGLYTFGTRAGEVHVVNLSGTPCYVRINGTAALPASATIYDVYLDSPDRLRLGRDLGTSYSTLSVWFEAGADTNSFSLRGL